MKYCKLHGWCLIMLWLWNRELSLSPGMLHATALTYWVSLNIACFIAFSALTLLLRGRKGIRSVRTEWWGAGMVICLEQGVDLHMAQLMPLPLAVSSFSKIQIRFTFPVPTHPGSCRIRAIKWVCVCVFVSFKSRPILKHLMRFRWKVMRNMNLQQLGMLQPMEMSRVLWQNFSNPSVVCFHC